MWEVSFFFGAAFAWSCARDVKLYMTPGGNAGYALVLGPRVGLAPGGRSVHLFGPGGRFGVIRMGSVLLIPLRRQSGPFRLAIRASFDIERIPVWQQSGYQAFLSAPTRLLFERRGRPPNNVPHHIRVPVTVARPGLWIWKIPRKLSKSPPRLD